MFVSIIVARSDNGAIGHDGGLPWHLRSDLQRFKALTMGHHLIMGRKTFESIGRRLPGRTTIVLSRDPDYAPNGVLVARSVEEALSLAQGRGESEVFVCGGAEVYAQALALSDRIYLTQVHAQVPGEVFFPPLDVESWQVTQTESRPAGPGDDYAFTFINLEKCE